MVCGDGLRYDGSSQSRKRGIGEGGGGKGGGSEEGGEGEGQAGGRLGCIGSKRQLQLATGGKQGAEPGYQAKRAVSSCRDMGEQPSSCRDM